MLNLLSIKGPARQAQTIDEETLSFREDCAINNQINTILKENLPNWDTASLLVGFEMMQDLYFSRSGFPDTYNKGITTAIKRIIDVLQDREVKFDLRVPKSLLPAY